MLCRADDAYDCAKAIRRDIAAGVYAMAADVFCLLFFFFAPILLQPPFRGARLMPDGLLPLRYALRYAATFTLDTALALLLREIRLRRRRFADMLIQRRHATPAFSRATPLAAPCYAIA